MSRIILDTDICIYIIKKKPPQVFEKFRSFDLGDIAISSITYAELQFGVQNSSDPDGNAKTLNKFVSPLNVLDYSAEAGVEYGKLRSYLKKKGKAIGSNDMFIASHALALQATLVSNNTREYYRVPGLTVENWV